jgi:hypothetical protein
LITLKITIISTDNVAFKLSPTANNNNIYEMLGFDDKPTDEFYSEQKKAPYIFNMIGVHFLHTCTSYINIDYIGVKIGAKYNILDTIQVIAAPTEIQTYKGTNNIYIVCDYAIAMINIIIYDQDFNVLNFNNIDWYMTLNIKYVYKKELISSEYLTRNQNNDPLTELLLEEERNLLSNSNI